MRHELRFEGRVAIVTGAGNGLGRAHARLLAARGARVVVNDLGGSGRGEGRSASAADRVVEEIRAAGGEAVASHDSVEEGGRIVEAALDTWGRLDILVNNAGILRDASFAKMTEDDWAAIQRVHLLGAFRVTQAAWRPMREAGYGRVVFTSSAAGLYGNFGQANYAAAKLGLVGLARTLAVEGQKRDIRVHAICPIAGSRLTETVLPPQLLAALQPEHVSALVAWLCHEACDETGGVYEVGGGFVAGLRWQRAAGALFDAASPPSPEQVRAAWGQIANFDAPTYPADVTSALGPILENATRPPRRGNDLIDVDAALAAELPTLSSSYDERDVALYALGVGAGQDPLDARELPFVYEGASGFAPLPTFGAIPALNGLLEMARGGRQIPGLNFGFERILHGEQLTRLLRLLPARATLSHRVKVKAIFDKGEHAVVVLAITSTNEAGEELVYNEITQVVRGAGGWGGERGPSGERDAPPDRPPDAVVEERTSESQALLYRLSGDWNPLHADPDFARAFGFERPILQGLCTYGIAVRHVLRAFGDSDPARFLSVKVRFAGAVVPGETLVTEMWRMSAERVVFRTRVKERDQVVLGHAAVELGDVAVASPTADAAKPSASAAVIEAIGAHVAAHPELLKIGMVYQWRLRDPDSEWVLDLKEGGCRPGRAEKADCTLELAEADFLAMSGGKADPQKLYFGGKLKISGNVMASQRLEFLKDVGPAKATTSSESVAAPEAPSAPGPSEALLLALGERLLASADLAGRNARVEADPPSLRVFVEDRPVAAFRLDDAADLAALLDGTVSARALHQRGRLRVDGDLRLAHHLDLRDNRPGSAS